MTPSEGRSLLKGGILILALSAVRFGVDLVGAPDPVIVEESSDLPRLLEESRDARAEAERRSTPLAEGEALDPNRVGEEELDRLPGIGPATARAWVADREENGGFGKPEDLLAVPGIGPATLEKIRPYLDFSRGVPRGFPDRGRDGEGVHPPRPGSAGRAASKVSESPKKSATRVDLNRATPEQLQSLPGIGPALADRIVESRREYGPFSKPEDLLRVRGIGPATLARIRDLVSPRGLVP